MLPTLLRSIPVRPSPPLIFIKKELVEASVGTDRKPNQ
jgi:hypothetical protein